MSGYAGMTIAVRANVRVAEAAKTGLPEALKLAFNGGADSGLAIAGLALFGVAYNSSLISLLHVLAKEFTQKQRMWKLVS